jgi:hypothetical protein
MLYLVEEYSPFAKDERPDFIAEADMLSLSPERDHTV